MIINHNEVGNGIAADPHVPARLRTIDEQAARKPLLSDKELPGPLSLTILSGFGAMSRLDGNSGYQTNHAGTLYGRSTIVQKIAPHGTIVCALTAAWIWVGGLFPETVDVISRSHYRAPVHDRKIRVFNRKSPYRQIVRVGDLRVTTPARTVCDLALLPEHSSDDGTIGRIIMDVMMEYRVLPADCLDILGENPFWPRVAVARGLFEELEQS
ncbi:hypothetical protein DSM100688_0842 [Bifidobacterium ramosum]|uniref:AbiEi antitoxin C-terminal domain-containing protein n=1 Tax=Bifidobacterium ramosum TaxID=1798158 RepID=A0A6L4X0D3_9BIFI|nr:hypothetical protein [Bifidobacterium ramosum]KAB8288275.1 hypothetical protein DSM100688_0842 [Bifidobacterium ramosum]